MGICIPEQSNKGRLPPSAVVRMVRFKLIVTAALDDEDVLLAQCV